MFNGLIINGKKGEGRSGKGEVRIKK